MKDHAVINETSSSRHGETLASRQIRTDALLPQLEVILNPDLMKDRLQAQIFSSAQERERFRIRACKIPQVRYKPESSCMVTYRLDIEDTTTGITEEQALYGLAYPEGRSQLHWEKARGRAVVQPRFGKPVVYLLDLEMVLWSFPNDHKLRGLPYMADLPTLRREVMPEVIANTFGSDWHIRHIAHAVIRYKIGHTCIVQVRLQLQHGSTGKKQSTVLYGKTYDNEDGAETYRNMRQLWEGEARTRGQLGVAQPVAYQAESKSLWVTALAGKTLSSYVMTQPKFLELLEQAAITVSALHRSPIACSGTITIAGLVAALQDAETTIGHAIPSFSRTLQRIVKNLILQSQRFGTRPLVTLHHDLHLKNMYVRSGKVALIDLDNLCLGDPLYDIGRFIASIHTYGLMQSLPEKRVRQINDVFVGAYRRHVPWDVPQQRVDWYVTTSLIVKNASRCAKRLQSSLLGDLADLIERVSRDAAVLDELSLTTKLSTCVNSQAAIKLNG
jgi:thiamine kinase-like enzyme